MLVLSHEYIGAKEERTYKGPNFKNNSKRVITKNKLFCVTYKEYFVTERIF